MPSEQTILVWDLPTRAFHWLLVLAVTGSYVTGKGELSLVVHAICGYTILGLVAFRLLWGFAGTRYARFASFRYGPRRAREYLESLLAGRPQHFLGHNPAGSWAIYALLALAAASGMTGWLSLHEYGGEFMEDVHEGATNALLAVVLLHVIGAIASSLAHGENLVRAMVDGRKRGRPEEGLRGSVWIVGVLLLAGVAAFWGAALRGDLPAITQPALERQANERDDD